MRLLQIVRGPLLVVFIAMKVAGGISWSWWWALLPEVPVLTEAFHLAQRNALVK